MIEKSEDTQDLNAEIERFEGDTMSDKPDHETAREYKALNIGHPPGQVTLQEIIGEELSKMALEGFRVIGFSGGVVLLERFARPLPEGGDEARLTESERREMWANITAQLDDEEAARAWASFRGREVLGHEPTETGQECRAAFLAGAAHARRQESARRDALPYRDCCNRAVKREQERQERAWGRDCATVRGEAQALREALAGAREEFSRYAAQWEDEYPGTRCHAHTWCDRIDALLAPPSPRDPDEGLETR